MERRPGSLRYLTPAQRDHVARWLRPDEVDRLVHQAESMQAGDLQRWLGDLEEEEQHYRHIEPGNTSDALVGLTAGESAELMRAKRLVVQAVMDAVTTDVDAWWDLMYSAIEYGYTETIRGMPPGRNSREERWRMLIVRAAEMRRRLYSVVQLLKKLLNVSAMVSDDTIASMVDEALLYTTAEIEERLLQDRTRVTIYSTVLRKSR